MRSVQDRVTAYVGRAERPGQRRAPVLVTLALVAASFAACGTSSATGGAHRPVKANSQKNDNGLVGYPAYLPKSTLHFHTDTTLVGTAIRPALTSQGDQVKVITPDWSVVAVVSGPEVPGEGLSYQTPVTTCTWSVTLSHATGPVPISASDFYSTDQHGNIYRPQLVPGQPTPPSVLQPGQKTTFELRAGETVGEGLMQWTPIKGQVVAKWDFIVEND